MIRRGDVRARQNQQQQQQQQQRQQGSAIGRATRGVSGACHAVMHDRNIVFTSFRFVLSLKTLWL